MGLDDFLKECSDLVGAKIVSVTSEYYGTLTLKLDNGISLRIEANGGGHNSFPYLLMDVERTTQ
jgi:hypothetical protein